MADSDAKREARRRRILENLDHRLEKITGKYKENYAEEKSTKTNFCDLQVENDYITNQNISTLKKKLTPNTEETDSSIQDNNSHILKSNVQLQQFNQFTLGHSNSFQDSTKNYNNYDLTVKSTIQFFYEKFHYTAILFFKTFSYILLAAFINILFILNIDFNLYKGIVSPYIILSIIHLCLGHKLNKVQTSNILMTVMILFNIKPEFVHNLKIILALCSSILKDFALYLTSFVFINWIIFIYYTDLNLIQYF